MLFLRHSLPGLGLDLQAIYRTGKRWRFLVNLAHKKIRNLR